MRIRLARKADRSTTTSLTDQRQSRLFWRYAYLTGKPPLPPLWSLGFQQSRYSYTPESQIREIANHLRADKIPSDVLYLDIDYQDRNRPFTVDPVRFPKFEGLVSDLRKQQFHLVVITDLHIAHVAKQHYMPYDTGHAGDHYAGRGRSSSPCT